jgi:CheY-like chemotaxis protein
MAARLTVLVVAPDRAMRRSLTFALEAEGYSVDAKPRLHAGQLSPDCGHRICAIVDEDAFADGRNAVAELSGLDVPVILLVERAAPPPARAGLCYIEKPLLGRDLLDAVARVSSAGGATYVPVGR